jgi:hypothetical protein
LVAYRTARRIGIAPSTVRTTIRRFQAAGLSWPLADDMTDAALEARLFPEIKGISIFIAVNVPERYNVSLKGMMRV